MPSSTKKKCLWNILWIPCSPAWVYNLVVTDCDNFSWVQEVTSIPTDIHVQSATFTPSTNILLITETDWWTFPVNLWAFWITTNILPDWDVQLLQWWVVKALIHTSASTLPYSNTSSWLTATTVQWAIDEIEWLIPWTAHKEVTYWVMAPTSPQLWDRWIDTSWWLPWVDRVRNWSSWLSVASPSSWISGVVLVPYMSASNSWWWPGASNTVTINVPAWKTIDHVVLSTDWSWCIATLSGWTYTSTEQNTSLMYYITYWFLWSYKQSYLTYIDNDTVNITIEVFDPAAVSSISAMWAVYYK